MLVSLISYVDRQTLAQLSPTILAETKMSREDFGYIVAAFSVTYAIGNPLWGRLLDHIGVRWGMLISVAFWTLASASHSAAGGFWGFAIARAALGFGEGATFPGGLRTAMQTLPVSQHARGMALAYSGGAAGAIVTPLIVTPIMLWWGWRAAFLFTGLIGLAWLVCWEFVSRRPDLRTAQSMPQARVSLGEVAVRMSLGDPRVWSFVVIYAFGALPIGFILYSASLYLNAARDVSQATLGRLLWIPPLGWEIGYFFWGWVIDRARRTGTDLFQTCRLLLALLALASLPFAAVPHYSSLHLVMAGMFAAMFMTAGFVIVPVSYATHLYTTANSGLIAGLGAGSFGAIVAITMPQFGRLFDQRQYATAFTLVSVLPIVGYACWLAINRSGTPGSDGAGATYAKQQGEPS